jgi:hypothetical protein
MLVPPDTRKLGPQLRLVANLRQGLH